MSDGFDKGIALQNTMPSSDTGQVKPIRFTRSARRHRIGKAHALHVMNTAEPVVDDVGVGWIGDDDRGVELEVYLVERPDVFLVIHVMPTALRGRAR